MGKIHCDIGSDVAVEVVENSVGVVHLALPYYAIIDNLRGASGLNAFDSDAYSLHVSSYPSHASM